MANESLRRGPLALAMLESFFDRGSEYFREMSVLVVVFIPIDLWKHAVITSSVVLEVFGASALLYLLGMACEWTAFGVRKRRDAWVEEAAP